MKKIVLVGVLLIIVAGLIYFQENIVNDNYNIASAMSPKEVYLALKQEAATAKDLDSMITIYQKYLTDEFFQETNIRVQAVPIDQKPQVFEELESLVVPLSDINIDTISENIVGDSAIVIAYSKNNSSLATISSTRQNGMWKISSSEDWVNGSGK